MDSTQAPDRLSTLPNALLIIILSCLPFKECVSTSSLSRRWRYLCRETRNLSFRECDYVSRSITDDYSILVARNSFFNFMETWISRIRQNQVVESFEICISYPWEFAEEIIEMIKFAVSKQVKRLYIDLSHPTWSCFGDLTWAIFVELPESVYNLTSLESLKIYACEFCPSKFTNLGLLRNLSIGWIGFENLNSFLAKCPSLESLKIKECWGLNITGISEGFRELIIENSDFSYMKCSFNLPKINMLKYSGNVFDLYFDKMNEVIKEVYLEFGLESEYDEPNKSSEVTSEVLSRYLNDLRAARTLTVCPYLLQVIQECVDPKYLLCPVETEHLVLRTKMHPKEFNGIRILLNNCPNLETLTFEILPPSPFGTALSYAGIDPRTYWMQNVTYECVRKTLKVVTVRNFTGSSNELNILTYLIRSGGEPGAVLERIELYVRAGLKESQAMEIFAKAEMLQRTSKHVDVLCAQLLVTQSRFIQ